ncbi:MAG: recombinase family protein [Blastocatellia bacterium]
MKIAAIYARVSSARQQQNETIASQVASLLEYAKAHDYQIAPQHQFQDDGYSGARLDRPALDHLRDSVARGEVEAVLVLSPDRLARQFAYQYVVIEDFERAGCAVEFVSHQGLGATPAERMLIEMTGVFAEYERAQIAERCRRGKLFRAREGEIWIKEAPYGYQVLPRNGQASARLTINETEAEVVRMIYGWLLNDQLSTYQITKRLNEAGIRTRRGLDHWSASYVSQLMRHPIYAGTWYYNRRQRRPASRRNMPKEQARSRPVTSQVWRDREEWIAIPAPVIIEPQTWELAQEHLRMNKERATRNTHKHQYLLSGLLVCGCCQVRMHGQSAGDQGRRRRYVCARKQAQHAHPERCPNRTVIAETIEDLVWRSVSQLLSDPSLLCEQYQLRQAPGYGTPEQQEQLRLDRRLTVLGREDQRLLDAFQAGAIELPDLKQRREQIAQERQRLESRLLLLKQQQNEQQQQATMKATLEEFCRQISGALSNPDLETKQKILRLVVDRIEFKNDQVIIRHLVPMSTVGLQRHHRAAALQTLREYCKISVQPQNPLASAICEDSCSFVASPRFPR